ncbi:MAG TPA: L,D-transpeptidase family protein [Thermoanaerobaculia bacterium]|nr:L,D-transpeptidase family protein [Thermoanaerobaculia bacterium]
MSASRRSTSWLHWAPVLLLSALALAEVPGGGQAPFAVDQTGNALRARLSKSPIEVFAAPALAPRELGRFFARREYAPAWTERGRVRLAAWQLLGCLRRAGQEGLEPRDYHLAAIAAGLAREAESSHKVASAPSPVELELALSDAFLAYASDLAWGRVDPRAIGEAWGIDAEDLDPAALLEQALGGRGVSASFCSLVPEHGDYEELRQALVSYRALEGRGGWPLLPPEFRAAPGEKTEKIALLRARLRASGDLGEKAASNEDFYDDALAAAVRGFERRHGLPPDGKVGKETLAALNVPVEERISQLRVNLERRRWLKHDLGPRYVLVNIAAFELLFVEDGEVVLRSRVVVGDREHHTPRLDSVIEQVELNPAWEVPPKIAAEELLPAIRRDPEYLAREGIRVLEGWGPGAKEIDPATIDWPDVDPDHLRFRFRQEPGPLNPLGRIKLIFPNPFALYLHDTPAPGLFKRSVRALSHGCIRVEATAPLAHRLLLEDPSWSDEKIERAIADDRERVVALQRPLPLHIVYWTVWANSKKLIQFRRDVYHRDETVLQALTKPRHHTEQP